MKVTASTQTAFFFNREIRHFRRSGLFQVTGMVNRVLGNTAKEVCLNSPVRRSVHRNHIFPDSFNPKAEMRSNFRPLGLGVTVGKRDPVCLEVRVFCESDSRAELPFPLLEFLFIGNSEIGGRGPLFNFQGLTKCESPGFGVRNYRFLSNFGRSHKCSLYCCGQGWCTSTNLHLPN